MTVQIPILFPPSNMQMVETHIEQHPRCTAREIVDALGLHMRGVQTIIERLRNNGRVKRSPSEATRPARWEIGLDHGITPKNPRDGAMLQRTVSEWEPPKVAPQSWLSALG